MKRTLLASFLIVGIGLGLFAQQPDSIRNYYQNSAEKLLETSGKLVIGGYGEIHYNQPINAKVRSNGIMDVHRMVMLLGYNFNSKTQFISEIEFEHVVEVYIEQAFLQHKLNNFMHLRAGLVLIPMGIVNEYHEPTTFNGVERPLIDNRIAPSTWREIGVGLTGNITRASLKYQAYIVNGFNGYDGKATFSGKNAFRNGRQKGADSYISSPNFTGKVEYYGLSGLNIGFSGYFGKSQSTLYSGLKKDDAAATSRADSSVVGISMIGIDTRYNYGGLQLRGQLYYTSISNSAAYNQFTRVNGTPNDLGSAMTGYYVEAGYNIFRSFSGIHSELIPFCRFESYNTHASTASNLVKNKAYNMSAITTGLTYKLTGGAVLKADLQFVKPESESKYSKVFNAGIGVMF